MINIDFHEAAQRDKSVKIYLEAFEIQSVHGTFSRIIGFCVFSRTSAIKSGYPSSEKSPTRKTTLPSSFLDTRSEPWKYAA